MQTSTSPVERRRATGMTKKYILDSSAEEFFDDPDDETFHVSPVKRKESLAKSRRTSKVKNIRQSAIKPDTKKKADKVNENSNTVLKDEVSDDSPFVGECRVKKRTYVLDETSDSNDESSPVKKSKGKNVTEKEGKDEDISQVKENDLRETKFDTEKINEKPKRQSKRSKVTESRQKKTKTKDKGKSPRRAKVSITGRKTSRKSAAAKKNFVIEDSLVEDVLEEDENLEAHEKSNSRVSSVRSKIRNEPLTEIPSDNKKVRKVRNSSMSRCSVSTLSEDGEERRSRRTKQISYKEPSLHT